MSHEERRVRRGDSVPDLLAPHRKTPSALFRIVGNAILKSSRNGHSPDPSMTSVSAKRNATIETATKDTTDMSLFPVLRELRRYRPDSGPRLCHSPGRSAIPSHLADRFTACAWAAFRLRQTALGPGVGEQLAQVSCDPAVIACERGDIPKSSKPRSQPRLRRVTPQRDQFSGFLPWIEAEARERGEDRYDTTVPVLADRRIEESLEFGRVRVEDIGCGHRRSIPWLQERKSSLFPRRIRAGRSWRPYTGQCRRRSQRDRNRFGARG